MEKIEFGELNPRVVLGVAAHPDDLDFGASGSMATFARSGADVHYLILTDGSKGSADLTLSSTDLVKMREDEQWQALKLIGGQSVTFLGYPDGCLMVSLELKKDIVKVIRTVKPDVVVTMDPSMIYSTSRGFINHPDHRAAGQAALDAVFPLARDHLSFPELYADGFLPHKTKTVLMTNFDNSNFFIDISETFEIKMAALKAHASQILDLAKVRELMESTARRAGQAAGYNLAEGFVRVDVR